MNKDIDFDGDDWTAIDWCKEIIEGVGGMNGFEKYELVVWHESDRVCAAHWALKCLKNPKCKGSKRLLDSIIEERRKQEEGNGSS